MRPAFAATQTPTGVPVNGLTTFWTIDATLSPRAAIAPSIKVWFVEPDGRNNVLSGQSLAAIQTAAGTPLASRMVLETDDMSIPSPARKPATVSSDTVSRFIINVFLGQIAYDTQTPILSPVESVTFLMITGMEIWRADSKVSTKPWDAEFRFTNAELGGHIGIGKQIPIISPDESVIFNDMSPILTLWVTLIPARMFAIEAAPPVTRMCCEFDGHSFGDVIVGAIVEVVGAIVWAGGGGGGGGYTG